MADDRSPDQKFRGGARGLHGRSSLRGRQLPHGRAPPGYFAVETAGEALHVGNVWLWAIDHRHRKAELRVVIGDAAARGRGIGAAAIDRMCRRAFDEHNLHRVYAYVLAINPAARRAFERAGFTLEGTMRDDRLAGDRFIDTYLMARVSG